ncbi:MAG: hypothetical protein CMP32_03225 [Rickettsiales bacterium]|nr:hypothetical protein [Rickettsiales bacterium]
MTELKTEHKIIKLIFKKIESSGWENFNFNEFSREYKIPIVKIRHFFVNKNQIITKFSKMIDFYVEQKISADDINMSSIKDNLFELIMLRFEEMEDYKISLRIITQSLANNPLLLSRVSKNILNSLDFYLELSQGYDRSSLDLFKKNILFLVYSYCFNVWLNDSTPDLSSTMAELDKLLSMAENFSKKFKEFLPI